MVAVDPDLRPHRAPGAAGHARTAREPAPRSAAALAAPGRGRPDAAEARQGHGLWAWIARRGHAPAHPDRDARCCSCSLARRAAVLRHPALDRREPRRPAAIAERAPASRVLADEFPGGDADPIGSRVTWSGADSGRWRSRAEAQAALAEYVAELGDLDRRDPGRRACSNRRPAWTADHVPAARLAMPADRATRRGRARHWTPDLERLDRRRHHARGRAAAGCCPTRTRAARSSTASARLPAPDGAPRRSPPACRRDRATSWRASRTRSRSRWPSSSAVTAVVLFLTFGSVFLPIKAVLMSLLSVTA